jgi:spore coat polysaccharide biosynthesis protein SpsF
LIVSIYAFIQARMSSRRFPGKVLARLDGIPVLARVVDRVSKAVPKDCIVVTTSTDRADDALAEAAASLGVSVHRGPLNNVMRRFQLCLAQYPCDWFFRVCADSPLLDPGLLLYALRFSGRKDVDLVTNVFPRTFPRGQSVEMIRSAALAKIDAEQLSPDEQEHVTKHFYSHPEQFRILNCQSATDLSGQSFTVDTPEDLARLEKIVQAGEALPRFEVKSVT